MKLKRDDSLKSISAVKSVTEGKESFCGHANAEVSAQGKHLYSYRNIEVSTHYDAGYMQMVVSVLWENDTEQVETFEERKLRGTYNTNFQKMHCNGRTLTILAEPFQIDLAFLNA